MIASSQPVGAAGAAGASGAPSAAASSPASSTATEVVRRPDPGLARGVWEAPPWAFWAALVLVVAAATLYALNRAGVLRRPARGPKA